MDAQLPPPAPAVVHIIAEKVKASPLQPLSIAAQAGGEVRVTDAAGREYFRAAAGPQVQFIPAGPLGMHTIHYLQGGTELAQSRFTLDAQTGLSDSAGQYAEFFRICERTMKGRGAGTGEIQWRGRAYRYYVPWILDHVHTAKGMYYFSDATGDMVDLFAAAQKPDGMVWSFVRRDQSAYYMDAHAADGYAMRIGEALFSRQPVENHNEYNFVDGAYLAWKASGDEAWMKGKLDACIRALDYTVASPVRWSQRFGLLKRGYTIDSWDFQVRDRYFVDMGLAPEQRIHPEKTKFGVFFGDNHGYAHACDQLAEMLTAAGRPEEAQRFRTRSREIRERLDRLTWNGRFFTHRIEEDDSVQRDLGVDEKSQIAMSNAYALNRGIPHEQAVAILSSYQKLQSELPEGSPGEWYAIYPPFERGFGVKWQYMNGGVHGHAAGELARGAFEHGFESYGADILSRVGLLAKATGGTVKFAYTGASEKSPAEQSFTPVSIAAQANMDLRDQGPIPWMHADGGNDLRSLPTGTQTLAGVPWLITDPGANGGRAAIAVGTTKGLPQAISLPVGKSAGAVYLLHAVSGLAGSGNAGAVTFVYADGGQSTTYIQRDKHISGWWYPELKQPDAGVAWRGPNPRSRDVGVSWAAIANPNPEKPIRQLTFSASLDGPTYAVIGVTLADRMPWQPAGRLSTGGPDQWSGGLCMAALVEGLAGIKDTSCAFRTLRLSPRWPAAEVKSASITARYPASAGYVSYQYQHDPGRMELVLSSSAEDVQLRLLMPPGIATGTMQVDGKPVEIAWETVEQSRYACARLLPRGLCRVLFTYVPAAAAR